MNILYIAYSCAPESGSENKIGWMLPRAYLGMGKVYVITKEEHREEITLFLQNHQSNENPNYYFVDIPSIYKKIFKGSLYSGRLNIWHKYAYSVAKRICKDHDIDIIHQITPIEFRSIGNYMDIENVRFIAGPLGGGEYIPKALNDYARGHIKIEYIRSLMNCWSRLKLNISGKLKRCDCVLFANEETSLFLGGGGIITPEIAEDIHSNASSERFKTDKCVFLVAGRLIYRKGLDLLLDSIEKIPSEMEFECRIVGNGPEYNFLETRCQKSSLLKKHITLVGKIDYEKMEIEYQNADVLIMPSIRETTGSVILEAMSRGVPVITIDSFGAKLIVDNTNGWLYSGKNKSDYIENLAGMMCECIRDSELVAEKSKNALIAAENNTWSKKAIAYDYIYNEVVME